MQGTRRRRAAQINPDLYDVDHPFIRWYVSYWRHDAARCVTRPGDEAMAGDLFMGELAASRFSLGVAEDRTPVLGIAEGDAEALMSIRWSGAAFLRRVQRRDWVALSCPDARIQNSSSQQLVPLRLWLPATHGMLDGWLGIDPAPNVLRLVEAAIRRGQPEAKGGAPLAELSLTFKGVWQAEPVAA